MPLPYPEPRTSSSLRLSANRKLLPSLGELHAPRRSLTLRYQGLIISGLAIAIGLVPVFSIVSFRMCSSCPEAWLLDIVWAVPVRNAPSRSGYDHKTCQQRNAEARSY